jgi:hypothetical protein
LQRELVGVRAELEQYQATSIQYLVKCLPGDNISVLASSQLRSSWFKKQVYELGDIVSVHRIENPHLQQRYDTYKGSLSGDGGDTMVFHGCIESAMDLANPDSIIRTGFSKKYWKTSAGNWQRFGPGFYFGQQASKSHEYPLPEMRKLGRGQHIRRMLMCKVACGRVYSTTENVPDLQGAAPEGYREKYIY